MRKYLFPLLTILALGPLSSQTVEVIYPFDFTTDFADVFVAENGTGFAIGDCGVLAKTSDDGANWTIQEAPFSNHFSAIACLPGSNCQTIFMGGADFIARSTDGGQSWSGMEVAVDDVRDFHFIENGDILISHSDPSLFRSTDNGESWSLEAIEESYRDRPYFVNSTTGYLFLLNNTLLKTTNAGISWDSIYAFDNTPYYASFLNENVGFMTDQGRNFYKTIDGGNNWTTVNTAGTPSNMRAIFPANEQEIIGYVFPDNIFASTDGGLSWSLVENRNIFESGYRYNGIHQRGDDFWIASSATEILSSNDRLQTANSAFPANRYLIEDMAFPTNNTGYALTERNSLLKTTDGGSNWTYITTEFGTVSRDMHVVSEDELIIAFNSRPPQRSLDGGQSWSPVLPTEITDTLTTIVQVEQLPSGRIVFIASRYAITSDENGENWTVIPTGTLSYPRSLYFFNNNLGFAGLDSGRLLRTNDGGLSWTLVAEGDFTNLPIRSIFMLDPLNGFINLGSQDFCTIDGGITWNADCGTVSSPGKIVADEAGNLYTIRLNFSGQTSTLLRSTNNGQSWDVLLDYCTYLAPELISPNGRYFYMTFSGSLMARLDLDLISSTNQIPRAAITPLSVFPNPNEGLFHIAIPEQATGSTVELIVYDFSGRLISRQQYPKQPQIDINISHLPNGVYTARLQGEGWLQSGRIIKSN